MKARIFLIPLVLLVFSTNLAFGQANDVQCNKCVDVTDLNTNSVGTARIINEAVTSAKIKNGAISTLKIKGGAITSGKIKDGTVRSQDVDAAQVQLRVAGSCAVGMAITSINENGSVTCGPGGPRAVARVLPGGNIDQNRTSGITAVSNVNEGIYCLTPDPALGLDPTVDSAIVWVDWISSFGNDLFAFYSSGTNACAAGEFVVRTYSFADGAGVMTLESSVTFMIAIL